MKGVLPAYRNIQCTDVPLERAYFFRFQIYEGLFTQEDRKHESAIHQYFLITQSFELRWGDQGRRLQGGQRGHILLTLFGKEEAESEFVAWNPNIFSKSRGLSVQMIFFYLFVVVFFCWSDLKTCIPPFRPPMKLPSPFSDPLLNPLPHLQVPTRRLPHYRITPTSLGAQMHINWFFLLIYVCLYAYIPI